MPLQSMLVRVRTVEIFGTLLPGIFVISSVGVTRLLTRAQNLTEAESHVAAFFNSDPKWITVATFVVASYLCGSMIRVLPGRIVDDLVGRMLRRLFQWRYFPPRVSALYQGHFPYLGMLRRVHEELRDSGYLDDFGSNGTPAVRDPREGIEAPSFDYWKLFVAGRNPGLASRNEAAESRTRFFYGMFWATVIAVAVSLFTSVFAHRSLPLAWAALSTLLLSILVARYRFVTGEEVREVYTSFLIQSCIDQREIAEVDTASDSSTLSMATSPSAPRSDKRRRLSAGVSSKAAQPADEADDVAAVASGETRGR